MADITIGSGVWIIWTDLFIAPFGLRMDRFFLRNGKIGREFRELVFKDSNSLPWQIRRGADSGRTLTSKTLFKLDEVFFVFLSTMGLR